MDDNRISYYVHENIVNKLEMQNKRLFFFMFMLILALLLTNGAWILYECSYQDLVMEQTLDVDGDNNINMNGIGGISNVGESTSNNQSTP